MSKWLMLLPVCFVLPGLARAQDDVIPDFTPVQVEKFIRDVMKAEPKRAVSEATRVLYATPNGQFDVEWRSAPKKALVFEYPYATLKAQPEHIKSWNQRAGKLTQGAAKPNGSLALSASLPLDNGMSFTRLTAFYQQIQAERKEFETFVQGPIPVVRDRKKGDVVRQSFPASAPAGKQHTTWEIEWDFVPSGNGGAHLLRILRAQFTFKDKNGQPKTVVVAREIQLSEAFSAYDDGTTSFLDLFHTPGAGDQRADVTIQPTPQLNQCVLPGETLSLSRDPKLKILREVHDDGLRWMTGYANKTGDNKGYRGEKLVLLAGFQAVNYVYLTEYQFTDDGRIICRLGFTAHNLTGRDKARNGVKDGDAHLHVGCWRMDFDLSDVTDAKAPVGGPASNDYRIMSRKLDATGKRFQQYNDAFAGGNEGKEQWKADEFTTLRVMSTAVKNAYDKPICYDLMPSRMGSVRGAFPVGDLRNENMDFVNYDFWVTRSPSSGPLQGYHKVPELAARQQPLKGNAATVWYNSPAFHSPRGEDFGGDGTANEKGVALTTWIEFTLRPRDMFDGTPFYP